MNDLKFAFRQLLKNPGFSAVAVLTLALGIGANTAIFSLINAALLRALPFPNANQLTVIWADNPGLKLGMTEIPPANADIAAWRQQSQSFVGLAAFSPRTADLTDGGDPERVGAAGVTAGFFETLGVTPLLGRTLAPDEEVHGGPPVALISHGLWQRRFGGDPALLGKGISINGDKRTIIGVLPPEFDFPRGAEWAAYLPFPGRTEVWLPLAFRAQNDGTGWSNWQSREERGLVVIGRLRTGASVRQAQAEMDAFAAREANDHPDTHKGWNLRLVPLREQLAGKSHKALLAFFAVAALFLTMMGIYGVVAFLVGRRSREIGIRMALGARGGDVLWLVLQQGMKPVAIGSLAGLLGSVAASRLIANQLFGVSATDPLTLASIVALLLATALLACWLPARRAARVDPMEALRKE